MSNTWNDEPMSEEPIVLTSRGYIILGAVAGVLGTLLAVFIYIAITETRNVGPTGKPLHITADCTDLKDTP